MTKIPSVPKYIQTEEVFFRAPDSESTQFKIGGTVNFILDHYVISPGMLQAFSGPEANIPGGWLVCDGRAVSRTDPQYVNLFNAIGTKWGMGDGVSTFNIPDIRGLIPRMIDQTLRGPAGRDPDAASRTPLGDGSPLDVGTYQQDEFTSHQHGLPMGGGGPSVGLFINNGSCTPQISDATGGNETRPKNVGVLYLVKL
jgi:hypothetical protein